MFILKRAGKRLKLAIGNFSKKIYRMLKASGRVIY
jgi:hypothetical protein